MRLPERTSVLEPCAAASRFRCMLFQFLWGLRVTPFYASHQHASASGLHSQRFFISFYRSVGMKPRNY